MTPEVPIATYGEALSDGTMLDLVRDPASGELNLLIWDGVTASVAPRFEDNGHIYVPASVDPVIRASRLPARVNSYASTRELFDDTCKLITRFNDLSEKFVLGMGYFIFGTWQVDRVAVAPFLSIIAPATAPSSVLLQLLGLLCRRPLLLGELNPSGLCTLPMHFRPTLLVDALRLSAPVQRLLRASNSQGVYVPRRGQALDLYCAKAVCSQEPLCDPSLVGLALQIAVAPTCQRLPLLDRQTSKQIADDFQAKLLMYRLKNYHNVCGANIDVGGLTAPMQSLARSLAACVVGDEELQAGVVPLLQQQDRKIRVETAGPQSQGAAPHLKATGHRAVLRLLRRARGLLGAVCLASANGCANSATPSDASWLNLVEPQFGVLKRLTLTNTHDARHAHRRRRTYRYLRYRHRKLGTALVRRTGRQPVRKPSS